MSQTELPRQITVAEMAPHVHHFGIGENKVNKISEWLISWIENSIKSGRIKPLDLLPSKGDLAFHIGVSIGTMQNVFRYVEDCGYVESKQRIGTYIKNPDDKSMQAKLTSKREMAVWLIKKYLIEENYQKGDCLISTRKLAALTGMSGATIRMAVNSLVSEKILKKINKVFVVECLDFTAGDIQPKTLVEKTADRIKLFIESNLKDGSRLPSNTELASQFNVSVKTIHDAVKLLVKDGLLYSRRGRYGTIVVSAGAPEDLYYYERVELKLKHYISENCELGSKLPPISELAGIFEVSAKTVKKALDNLAEDGYLRFSRGRYGGTFVTDIPQDVNKAYKWLALSSDYVSNT